nr:hypothetical protein [Tanacetum cinerariifolium]
NPHIYVSCIKQFWNTVSVKQSADVTRRSRLPAKLRDFYWIGSYGDAIREILRLDDAEGVVCFPNDEIFASLAQMGYEKPSTKLTFYKAFFSKEIADDVAQPTSPLPPSLVIPPIPPHQSPRTSLLQAAEGTSILVQQVLDKCFALVLRVKGLESDNTAQQLEILKLKAKVKNDEGFELVDDQEKDAQVKGRQADTQAEIYNTDLDHTSKVLSMQEDSEVQEVVEVVNAAKLMTEVASTAASIPIPAVEPVVAAVSTPISTVKPKKDQIAMDAEYARKLQEEEESLAQAKDAQATDVQPKDAPAKGIQYIRRYHRYKKKPQYESQVRKNIIEYLKNTEEEMEKEQEEIIKSINETPAQKAAKRRRLREQ